MSRQVRVNAGHNQIVLPDGRPYDGPVTVTLTDEQFARIAPNLFTADILDDLGHVADPDIDADFATDQEVADAVAPVQTEADDASVIELAYVENATGTAQPLTIAGGAADATLLAVTIPLLARPIYVRARVIFDVTTAPGAGGSGQCNLWIEDDQGTVIEQDLGAIESGSGTTGYVTLKVEGRIPANTPSRTYKARVSIGGQASFAAQILHGAVSPVFRSWIKAEKR